MSSHLKSAILIGLIFLCGCAAKNSRLEVKRGVIDGKLKEDKAYHPKLVPEEYVIEESDELQISVIGNSELTEKAIVRPDGVVTYDLIGQVPIAGMTVSQAEKYIEEKISEYVKEAKVSIQVTSFASKKIYVFGRVQTQGPQPFTGKNTVLNTISQAGGLTPGAAIQNILVVRQDKVNPKVIAVNFKELVKKGLSTQDIKLKADDIVLVAPNIFGRTEEIVNTFLLPVGPLTSPIFTLQALDNTFGLNLSGNKNSGGGTSTSNNAAASFAGATAASAATNINQSTVATTTSGTTTSGP